MYYNNVMELSFKIQQSTPRAFLFKDDGLVPNSTLSVLVYKRAIDFSGLEQGEAEKQIDAHVSQNDWYRDWTYHVYPFLHYHSTAHEGLIIYSGKATIQIGGKGGEILTVASGDMIIIPAGVGHERLLESDQPEERKKEIESLLAFGIYPNGQKWDFISEDLNASEDGGQNIHDAQVRKTALVNIQDLPMPQYDPLYGADGLTDLWK